MDAHSLTDTLVSIVLAVCGGVFHLLRSDLTATRKALTSHGERITQLETLAGIIR